MSELFIILANFLPKTINVSQNLTLKLWQKQFWLFFFWDTVIYKDSMHCLLQCWEAKDIIGSFPSNLHSVQERQKINAVI